MVKHNNVVPNQHFKKKWQFYVRTWFNQPARKQRRQAGGPRLCGICAACCSRDARTAGELQLWQHFQLESPLVHARGAAARAEKAKKVFPRPTAGPLRPIVKGQTVKYNTKRRLGRGFTFEELKVWGRYASK
jgi:large subunit ribosomal protein L13e